MGVTSLYSVTVPFQSTPSVGRATLVVGIIYGFIKISIHALRGEGDCGEHNVWWN